MKKTKFCAAIITAALFCLQYTSNVNAQDPAKDQVKMNQTNNDQKQETMKPVSKLEFKALPYSYDALEPSIDKQTVEIHYSKHHKAYYDNFMNAIKGTEMESMMIGDIFRNISKYPANTQWQSEIMVAVILIILSTGKA